MRGRLPAPSSYSIVIPVARSHLARFSHQVSQRGGADWHGYKARDRGPIRCSRQYVEEPEGVQRNRHARIRRRSKSLVRNAG